MKLKIMTSEALEYVKANINEVCKYYTLENDPEVWLKQKLGRTAFIEVPELEFEDFELIIDEEKPSSTDIANIKLLYLNLIDLNDSFATDERLWAGLSHTIFYEYMLKRWPGINDNSKSIIQHFFFGLGIPRSYMTTTLARLWWLGRKTYNEKNENPFEYLDFMANDINGFSYTLYGSNWPNSQISHAIYFDTLIKFQNDTGIKVGRDLFTDATKYMNALCGITVVDVGNKAISDRLYKYLVSHSEELVKENEQNKLNNVKKTGIAKLDNLVAALNIIGGHGKIDDIFKAYESIIQSPLSLANKTYIRNSLQDYSASGDKSNGNPIFHKTTTSLFSSGWRLSNRYLTKDNLRIRRDLIRKQIENLDDNDMITFNLVSAISKEKFVQSDVLAFSPQIKLLHPDIKEPDKVIKESLKSLKQLGIIEECEKNTFRKAYDIKIYWV